MAGYRSRREVATRFLVFRYEKHGHVLAEMSRSIDKPRYELTDICKKLFPTLQAVNHFRGVPNHRTKQMLNVRRANHLPLRKHVLVSGASFGSCRCGPSVMG